MLVEFWECLDSSNQDTVLVRYPSAVLSVSDFLQIVSVCVSVCFCSTSDTVLLRSVV